jgi:hypothetical protein
MGDPINYLPGLQPMNPLQAFGQAYGLGNGINQQIQARQDAQAQAQAAAERQKQQQELTSRVFGGTGSAKDRADLLFMMAPEQAKVAQTAFDSMDKETRTQKALEAGKIAAAYQSGNAEVGKQLMEERIAAQRESGDEAGAQLNEKLLAADEIHPGQLANYLKNTLALFPEGREMLDSQLKVTAEPHDLNLTDANAAKAWADAARMRIGPDLSPEADKIINSATDSVSGSLLLANQADNLAKAYDAQKPPAGWAGSALDWARKAAGGQGVFDALKQEYVKLRNTDVLKNLPPGVASDKDIEIALKAFPDENANPAQISAFLRGTAKLQRYSAEVNKARAEWVAQNGNLGAARAPLDIGDTPVEKGQSFWDFTATIPIPNVTPGASLEATPSGSAGSGAPPPASGLSVSAGGKVYAFKTPAEAKAFAAKTGGVVQ